MFHLRQQLTQLSFTSLGSASILASSMLCFAYLPLCAQASAQNPASAVTLQQRGDWAGAEIIWRQLTRLAPGEFRYWTSLGACLAHQNRFNEAIDDYRKSLRLSPQDPQTNYNLGLAYFKTGQLKRAIQPLSVAEKSLPHEAQQTRLLMGMSLYGTGQAAKAVPYLESAAAQEPANSQLQLVLARAYLEAGSFDKAEEQFVRMLSTNPDSSQVHLLLAQAYDGLGRSAEALTEFQTAARNGSTPGAHFGAGYLLLRDKHYSEAITEFRHELAANPDDSAALGYLGDALLKSGNGKEARSFLEASLALEDKLWITHFDLGIIAEQAKNYPAAIKEFRRAIAANPTRPEIHYRLAQACAAVGQNAEAEAERRKVRSLHAERNDDLVIKVTGKR